jgi:hypothetical protein
LLWFALQLTGSGAAVGLVILCFNLPGVLTGAILGRLLDHYQPRLVIGFDNFARAALIAAIPSIPPPYSHSIVPGGLLVTSYKETGFIAPCAKARRRDWEHIFAVVSDCCRCSRW